MRSLYSDERNVAFAQVSGNYFGQYL